MTISGVSLNHASRPHRSSLMSQDWQALGKALQSGDLSGAQSAFATLQADLQKAGSASTTQSSKTSLVDQALQTIGKALAAGDVASAQKAFADLQQQLQVLRQNRATSITAAGSRRNDHDQDDTAQAVGSSTANASASDQDSDSSGSRVNVSA